MGTVFPLNKKRKEKRHVIYETFKTAAWVFTLSKILEMLAPRVLPISVQCWEGEVALGAKEKMWSVWVSWTVLGNECCWGRTLLGKTHFRGGVEAPEKHRAAAKGGSLLPSPLRPNPSCTMALCLPSSSSGRCRGRAGQGSDSSHWGGSTGSRSIGSDVGGLLLGHVTCLTLLEWGFR
ncbi:UNVERIFIED_CONTAM: hypothetical protein K2H54_002743 [Gekko kuhli]